MHVTLIDSCIDTRGLNHGFDFIQMQHTILLLNIDLRPEITKFALDQRDSAENRHFEAHVRVI